MSVSARTTAPNVSAPSAREKEIFAGERAARLLHQPSAFKDTEIDHGVAEPLYQARYLLLRIGIVPRDKEQATRITCSWTFLEVRHGDGVECLHDARARCVGRDDAAAAAPAEVGQAQLRLLGGERICRVNQDAPVPGWRISQGPFRFGPWNREDDHIG
jgi:hypothetical protein